MVWSKRSSIKRRRIWSDELNMAPHPARGGGCEGLKVQALGTVSCVPHRGLTVQICEGCHSGTLQRSMKAGITAKLPLFRHSQLFTIICCTLTQRVLRDSIVLQGCKENWAGCGAIEAQNGEKEVGPDRPHSNPVEAGIGDCSASGSTDVFQHLELEAYPEVRSGGSGNRAGLFARAARGREESVVQGQRSDHTGAGTVPQGRPGSRED